MVNIYILKQVNLFEADNNKKISSDKINVYKFVFYKFNIHHSSFITVLFKRNELKNKLYCKCTKETKEVESVNS